MPTERIIAVVHKKDVFMVVEKKCMLSILNHAVFKMRMKSDFL